jgi:photosystem II stability/assembly factor-like uncharacterized protein
MQIDDVSPTDANFAPTFDRASQSISGKALCVAISNDGQRAYLGGHSGVWRSDDGGDTWWHPEWLPAYRGGPTPVGALIPTNVYDLVIDPTSNDIVFAGTGRDGRRPSQAGIYRSSDGARSWTRVHQFAGTSGGVPLVGVAGRLASVPDDPRTLYAAGEFALAWTTDGGTFWTERVPEPGKFVFHVVAGRQRSGGRRVYAVGQGVWYSLDGGVTWHVDPVSLRLGGVTDSAGASARALAMHPQHDNVVYLMQGDLTLWKGEYPDEPSTGPGTWNQLPAPPVAGGTDSGGTFVVPHMTPEGFVSLYASDRRSVHGVGGEPTSQSDWVRAEDGHCHVDPHGLALTPDFRPWGPDFSPPSWGRAVLVNDGGANVSVDGMQTWTNGTGLSTLNVVNVGVSTARDGPTAITFGTGDNEGFSSGDGAATWRTQGYDGGDNDCSFSDPLQPTRMLLFAPRSKAANNVFGEIYLFVSSDAGPPNTAWGSPDLKRIPAPPPVTDMAGSTKAGWNVVSHYFNFGYRPLVHTLAGADPRPDGDLVTIRYTGVIGVDPALLLRTTAISALAADSDWVTTATAEGPGVTAFQVGPPLPDPLVSTVQASGGHDAPTFYVGNAAPTVTGLTGSLALWKLAPGDSSWRQIVPAQTRGPTIARRFYADPYRPEVVYVLGSDNLYRSEDGGGSWAMDGQLGRVVTEAGAYPLDVGDTGNPAESVLRDMKFDPYRPGFRLAAGAAGVFFTADGHTWEPLLRSTAVSMQPTNITYDFVECDRAVYVGTSNRGLLRLSPLPPDWEFPLGSLQAAEGAITLLRVHDPGTGYGPPDDFLDVEVIVWLDTQPEKAFGFQLRDGPDRPVAEGMLALLRDCFNQDRTVRLEFVRTGCRTGLVIRVIERF